MREFQAEVPQAELDELQRRLESARWPDQLPDVEWSYGLERGRLKQLAEYWRTSYDWRRFEKRLNAHPQYVTEIDGQRVHFIHTKSKGTPLLLLHGWPGAASDFLELIEPLTESGFNLVIPTMPGFGFSGPTTATGWGVERIAKAWATLMEQLGYEQYGVHGYDWGARIGPALARHAPKKVIGLHLDGFLAFPTGDEELTDAERQRLSGLERWNSERSGYAQIQATRPQTLAYALIDSPVGQLAWNLEWYDDYGHRVGVIGNDQILDSVTLTWLTGTAGSQARIYREAQSSWTTLTTRCDVPTGLAVFPSDSTVRRLAERELNVVHYTEFDRGGHFAALEVPELVIEDLQAFFRNL
ncbi:pimeloyl-ACP methyl ester carboxylesterase [Kribbella antiqua]|uniref:Pimeloyl-ACP methyl ester carboxylesterase n=1 Tax=Kribbella antiqua TaxID=2512217 RepID=A0A4R2IYW6_9ACTN|nr:epoxide hydrolase family protein [Kribbella antiqua]TCO50497.1 pimeloyl-ACP methyl ester carboxylesterase [Kribbella antiqua]